MSAIVDFHGHLYPRYDPDKLLRSLVENGKKRFPGSRAGIPVFCLAERMGQRWFANTQAKGIHQLGCGWTATPCDDRLSLRLEKEEQVVFIVAGRQIISTERLEVLSLALDLSMDDSSATETVIERILESGGIPVLPWSPGKWMGQRGRVVQRMLDRFGPGKVLIGDTIMRPTSYSGGRVFRESKRAGFVHLPGSDPLPMSGEESQAGRYSALIDIPCEQPGAEIREYLARGKFPDYPTSGIGYFSVVSRSVRLRLTK